MKLIAEKLLDINAIVINSKNRFTWASGIISPIYTDIRLVWSHINERMYVTKEIQTCVNQLFPEANFVVGTATGGIPPGAYLSLMMNVPFAYIRPRHKEHGKKSRIEGQIPQNAKIIVVEDLISTGESTMEVVNTLLAQNYNVIGVISVFSYNLDSAKKRLANIKFASITNLDELLEVATEKKLFSNIDINLVKQFKNDLEKR